MNKYAIYACLKSSKVNAKTVSLWLQNKLLVEIFSLLTMEMDGCIVVKTLRVLKCI